MSLDTAAEAPFPGIATPGAQGPLSALRPRLRERALDLMKQLADLLLIGPNRSLAGDPEQADPVERRLSKLEFAYSLPSPEDLVSSPPPRSAA